MGGVNLPDFYILLLIGFGALVLLTAWLPMVLSEAPLSLPIACVGIGAAVFTTSLSVYVPHPDVTLPVVERLTELVILISLMGAALKIDRKIGWRSWMMTWRLLAIAMPVTIFCTLLARVRDARLRRSDCIAARSVACSH